MWEIILQLHSSGGGSSSSNTVSEWKPTMYQKPVIGEVDPVTGKFVGDENTALGNLLGDQGYMNTSNVLRDSATDQLVAYNNGPLGNYNYNNDLTAAQAQINAAQQGYANLASGTMPQPFQANMENAIRSGVENTVGSTLNTLAGQGVINSSQASKAWNDIAKNASNTMAEQYSNNIDTLGNVYNNQINAATAGMNAASTAQGNQYSAALDMLNAGIGSYNTASSVLGLGGTTSNVQSNRGGNGALSAAAGVASGVLGAFCFPAGTKIQMADNLDKNIEDVEVGDKVVTVACGEYVDVEVGEVVALSKPREEQVYEIVCVDRGGEETSVEASASQPFMTASFHWIELKDLNVGDSLLVNGKIESIKPTRVTTVYDLKVDVNNNYSANGFIVAGATDKEIE